MIMIQYFFLTMKGTSIPHPPIPALKKKNR